MPQLLAPPGSTPHATRRPAAVVRAGAASPAHSHARKFEREDGDRVAAHFADEASSLTRLQGRYIASQQSKMSKSSKIEKEGDKEATRGAVNRQQEGNKGKQSGKKRTFGKVAKEALN